MNKLLVL